MSSICFLVTGLDPIGGAEMQVANLAKAFHSRGWKVTVISMLPEGNRLARELRACGVGVATLRMQKGRADPRAIWRLAKMLKVLKPEVLHAHMVEANLLARATNLLAAVPLVVSTAHSICEGGRFYDLAYRLTDRLGDVTTNVCHAAARRYARDGLTPQKRLRVVGNGIDVHHFSPNHASRDAVRRALAISQKFVWLAIGGLREVKDYPNIPAGSASVASARIRPALSFAITGYLRGLAGRQFWSHELWSSAYIHLLLIATIVWGAMSEHYRVVSPEQVMVRRTGFRSVLSAGIATFLILLTILFVPTAKRCIQEHSSP